MSDKFCAECGNGPLHRRLTGLYRHPSDESARLCTVCWKRLVWRPRNGPAVERDRTAARARKEGYRGTCIDCGAPTNGSNGPGKASLRCVSCASRHTVAQGTRADMQRARVRAARIVELYEAGVPLKDIAADLGTSVNSLSVGLNRLRKDGRIGYRYKVENGRRVAA